MKTTTKSAWFVENYIRDHSGLFSLSSLARILIRAPVVWRLDNAIHRINCYWVDKLTKQTMLPSGQWLIWWIAISILWSVEPDDVISCFLCFSQLVFIVKKEKYLIAWRYDKTIFFSLVLALISKILFLPLKTKIQIFALPCNIFYISVQSLSKPYPQNPKF